MLESGLIEPITSMFSLFCFRIKRLLTSTKCHLVCNRRARIPTSMGETLSPLPISLTIRRKKNKRFSYRVAVESYGLVQYCVRTACTRLRRYTHSCMLDRMKSMKVKRSCRAAFNDHCGTRYMLCYLNPCRERVPLVTIARPSSMV